MQVNTPGRSDLKVADTLEGRVKYDQCAQRLPALGTRLSSLWRGRPG